MSNAKNKYRVEIKEKLKSLDEKKLIIEQQIKEYKDLLEIFEEKFTDEELNENAETN